MTIRIAGLVAAVACSTLGCSSPPLLTSQLVLNVDATADATQGTSFEAFMWDAFGGNTYELREGESLNVMFHGQRQSMTVDTSTTSGHYVAVFDAVPDQGESFTVDFERGSAPSAPSSVGKFPPTSVVTGPTVASRSQPMTVTWTPSGFDDPVTVYPGDADCAEMLEPPPITADPGTVIVPPLSPAGTDSCTATLTVTRELDNAGTIDPQLDLVDGSSIGSTWGSTIEFTSTP